MTLLEPYLGVDPGLELAAVRPTVVGRDDRSALPVLACVLKRTIDVVTATIVLLLALPIIVVAGLATKAHSPGPTLVRQTRVGRDGSPFTLYKLRTMVYPNDDSAHRAYVLALMRGEGERHDGLFKLTDDPRVTRVGRVLRRLSIDELPQLWNVLKGDMSLVGPRPSTVEEASYFDDVTRLRLMVRPGMSGLWQVSGRGELDFHEMVELDIRYWQMWSLRLEVGIMLRTPLVVLTGRGAA